MKTQRLAALCFAALIGGTAAHAATDTVATPSHGYTYQPFSYAHAALAGSFSAGSLRLTAFDIDAPDEIDTVYGYDAAAAQWLRLGDLVGSDNATTDTTFALPLALLDDVANGLRVKVDVSAGAPNRWGVGVDASTLNVAAVPEPHSWLMLVAGSLAVASVVRRKSAGAQNA